MAELVEVVEYAAAATMIPAYGVVKPFADKPSVVFSVVVANSADGRPYCNTIPAADALPPQYTGKPPGVAHVGTVDVLLSCVPAIVEIGKKVVAPAPVWYGKDPPAPPAMFVQVDTVPVNVPVTVSDGVVSNPELGVNVRAVAVCTSAAAAVALSLGERRT